jgi:hypothetical protein
MRKRIGRSPTIEALERRQLLTTYYLSPTGNDLNKGTSPTKAWASFTNVNNLALKAGDQILLQGGATFHSTKLILGADDKGTSALPIKVSTYGTGRAAVDGGIDSCVYVHNTAGVDISNIYFWSDDPADQSIGRPDGVVFYNDLPNNTKLSYIHINNCEFNWFGKGGLSIGGGNGGSGFNDVRVTNCIANNNLDSGFFLYGAQRNCNTNVYIGYCQSYDNTGYAYDSSVGVTGHGFTLGSCDGATIEYCEAYNCGTIGDGGAGIWTYDSNNVTIQYNESHNNHTALSHDGDGFDLDRNTSNSVMQYNYSHDNDGGGFMLCNKDNNTLHSGNVVRYNISQNDGRKNTSGGIQLWGKITNAEIYNNTVYMNQAPSGTHAALRIHNASIETNDVQHVHIRNNIFETEGTTQLVQVTATQLDGAVDLKFQGNGYFAHSGGFKVVWGATTLTSITAFRGKAQEMNGTTKVGWSGDPLLVAPGTAGNPGPTNLASVNAYKLQSTSPAINNGLNLASAFGLNVGTHDFWGRTIPQGAGYDVGAYEADASAPGSPPPTDGGGGGGGGGGGTGGSIAGTVFNDANGNGVRDSGEAGVAGVTVYNDANNNNLKDSGEASTVTDANGAYLLGSLAAGSYKIRQILQSGWSQTAPANGFGWTLTLGTDQVITGKDFGTKNSGGGGGGGGGGSISGKVWNDVDGDGVLDSGEVGIAGITVYNDANNNNLKDSGELTTTTDSSGNYTFASLAAGNYKIRQILQTGWSQTSPANGFGWTITLATNQVLTGKNFGTKNSGGGSGGGSIAGKVFNDANGNGAIDSGELGIANITVYNDANNNNVWDTGELKTLTDSSGNYILSNLVAGNYKIRQILQTGWSQTTPANGFGWTISLATNQALTGKNFGTRQTA